MIICLNFRHTGIRSFACHLCSSKFFVKSALRNHMFIHSGIKTHFCDFEGCSKGFNNARKDICKLM